MNYTDNLNLKKPEGTDVYNIENENDNMDIIDNTIHEHVELLGKTNEAGHVKIIDHLNKTAVANGEALSAHQGNVITTLLAPVEPTTTASRAYAIGEQFVLNGLLTEATAAISQGNTIVVGTGGNAKLAADVTSQLATIKSSLMNLSNSLTPENVSFTLAGTTATLHLYSGKKSGKECVVSFVWSNNASSSAGVDYTMGTLNKAPVAEAYASLISTTGQIIAILTLKTNGEVHIWFYSTYVANTQMITNFSYISA